MDLWYAVRIGFTLNIKSREPYFSSPLPLPRAPNATSPKPALSRPPLPLPPRSLCSSTSLSIPSKASKMFPRPPLPFPPRTSRTSKASDVFPRPPLLLPPRSPRPSRVSEMTSIHPRPLPPRSPHPSTSSEMNSRPPLPLPPRSCPSKASEMFPEKQMPRPARLGGHARFAAAAKAPLPVLYSMYVRPPAPDMAAREADRPADQRLGGAGHFVRHWQHLFSRILLTCRQHFGEAEFNCSSRLFSCSCALPAPPAKPPALVIMLSQPRCL
eukprot:jgi/Botrbrau1/19888/Bobra.0059s0009.1